MQQHETDQINFNLSATQSLEPTLTYKTALRHSTTTHNADSSIQSAKPPNMDEDKAKAEKVAAAKKKVRGHCHPGIPCTDKPRKSPV